jgi:hypothetical protein
MNILITNNSLDYLAGSEWVVIELAKTLVSRGHQVAACSSQIGEIGSLLREMSIPAIRHPLDSPFKPDIIHGQHHLEVMRALHAFPDVPAIYHCHGYLPWVEDAPVHPRILSYVGMCAVLSNRIRLSLGLPDESVITVPNWVDIDRFRFVRDPKQQPKKALLYSRSLDRNSWHASQLCQAFDTMKIQLDLHVPQGDTRAPEVVLPEYDIVLASGRSAIEAMACGCALLPISRTACLDSVDPLNFHFLQNQNFSPTLSAGHFNAESVGKALAAYQPDRVSAVTAMVRSECTLASAVDRLEPLYFRTVDEFRKRSISTPSAVKSEFHAVANYIQSIMPLVRDREKLITENQELQSRVASLQLNMDQAIAEKDQTIAAQNQAIAQKDQTIAEKDQALAAQNQAIAQNDQTIAEKDQKIAAQNQAIAEKDQTILTLLQSRSLRIAKAMHGVLEVLMRIGRAAKFVCTADTRK